MVYAKVWCVDASETRAFVKAESLGRCAEFGETNPMDMSGAMPRAAWVEIRHADGELLVSIPAEVRAGSITAELPAFPPGTHGTIQLCEDYGDRVERDERKMQELPTGPQMLLVQMG